MNKLVQALIIGALIALISHHWTKACDEEAFRELLIKSEMKVKDRIIDGNEYEGTGTMVKVRCFDVEGYGCFIGKGA